METTVKQNNTQEHYQQFVNNVNNFYNQLKIWLDEFPIDFVVNTSSSQMDKFKITFEFEGKINKIDIYPHLFEDNTLSITGNNYHELYFIQENDNNFQLHLIIDDNKNSVLLTKELFFEKILEIPYDINNWKVVLNHLNLDDTLNLNPQLISELDTIISKLLDLDDSTKIELFSKLINVYFPNISDICDIHTKAIEFFYTIESKKQCFDLDDDNSCD